MIRKNIFFAIILLSTFFLIIECKVTKKTCKTSSDCKNYYSCVEGFCIHKPFYSPFTLNESILAILLGIISGVCMGVGVGGGIYYIPLLSTLGSFYIKEVVPISNFLICITSIVAFLYNISNSHPKLDFRSLIDYNLAYTLLPPLFIGLYIGFYIHLVSPTIILFLLLVIIFSFLNYFVISKMLRVLKENQSEEDQENFNKGNFRECHNKIREYILILLSDEETLRTLNCNVYWKLLLMILSITCYVIFSHLSGLTGYSPVINLRSCSVISIFIFFFFFLTMISFSFLFIKFWQSENEMISKTVYLKQLHLDYSNFICIILVGLVAGISCSALGLGAGTTLNPVLLNSLENYEPIVISATTIFVMLIISTYGTLVYFSTGQLNLEYSLILSITCILGTLYGLFIINYLIKKRNDQSIIIYVIVFLIGLSTILLITSGTIDLIHEIQIKPKELFKFEQFCRN